jgi:hypothetical protein
LITEIHGRITIKFLCELAGEIIASAPRGSHLTELTRTQKRVKNGLFEWFDSNISHLRKHFSRLNKA